MMAKTVATRATCPRASVGCVIVKDKRVLSVGYNGSLPGEAHCSDAGCLVVDGHCRRTVHAEANAVAAAAKSGIALEGSQAFVTHTPCADCQKLLTSAGVLT